MTVEQLNVIITAQNTEFNRRLDEVNGRLDTMATTAERSANKTYSVFQGLAGKIAALGIGKIIADSITEGMNSIESESLFETSLGEYADNAREWSEKLRGSLSLDDYALRKNTTTLFNISKNMGLAGESALSLSENFAMLTEDMAAAYNLSSEEAFVKLRSGLTGETEPLKALGILVDENTVKQYAYQNGIAEVGAELDRTQKILARYYAIMGQTASVQGQWAREMEKPAGQWRILKNDIRELMRDTGTTLMPTVSSLLGMARSGLEIVAPLVTGLADGVNTVSQAIIDASPQTKTMLTLTLAAALAIPAVTKAQMLLTAAKGAYSALLTVLIPKQFTFAAALKATAGWLGIIAAAIGVFSLINDANSQAADTTSKTADAFADEEAGAKAAADGVDDLANSMDDLGKKATKSLAAVDKLNIFQGTTSGSVTGGFVSQNDLDMLGDADSILGDIQAQLSEIGDAELNPLIEPFIKIDEKTIYDNLKNANGVVEDILGTDWTNFFKKVGEGIHKFSQGDLAGGLESIHNGFINTFESIDQVLGTHLSDMYVDISDTLFTIGADLYRHTAGWQEIAANDFEAQQSILLQEMELSVNDYLREGMDVWDAHFKAMDEFKAKGGNEFYYEDRVEAGTARSIEDLYDAQKRILHSMQMESYTYDQPNYLAQTPAATGYEAATRGNWNGASPPVINNYTTIVNEIDGEEVASYVVSKETRTEEISNGY